jgi:hypothetical protein
MNPELRIWLGFATAAYVAAFIVWTRLAHAIRNRGSVAAAICFMPLIVAAAIESVSCGWLAFAASGAGAADGFQRAQHFGAWCAPFMAVGVLVTGVWGLVRLQCPNAGPRKAAKGFFRELVKAVPD